MVIETVLFIAFVIIAGVAIVKVYEAGRSIWPIHEAGRLKRGPDDSH